jgi:hypothetical protein
MSHTLLLHLANEDPVMVEVEEMPTLTDVWIKGTNPRRKDGKDVHYILAEVTTVLFPVGRINFIEVMPGDEREEIITTVRDERTRY